VKTYHLIKTATAQYALLDEQMMPTLGGIGAINLVTMTINRLAAEERIRVVQYSKIGIKQSLESQHTYFVSSKNPFVHKVL